MPGVAVPAFVLLAVVWGSTFVFAKAATDVVTPGQTAVLRVLCGFLPVLVYAVACGALRREHLRLAPHFVVMSLLGTTLQYGPFSAGSAVLPSGIAGALAGIIPVFSLLAAIVLLPGERVTRAAVAGVFVGLAGVVLLGRPWQGGGAVSLAGVGWMLLGSAAVGGSFVYAKRFLGGTDLHPAALTTYQLGIGLVTLALLTDLDGIGAIGDDAGVLVGTVVGLGLLGTGVAYLLFYALTARLGAVPAASSTYPPPVVALLIGWGLAGEDIGALDAVAVALVLGGVAIPHLGAATRRRRARAVGGCPAPAPS